MGSNQIKTISATYNAALKCYTVSVETFDHRSIQYRHKASSLESLTSSIASAIRQLERSKREAY